MRLLWSLTVSVVGGMALASASAAPASKEITAAVEAAAGAHIEAVAKQASWLEPQWVFTVLDNTPLRRGEQAASCAKPLIVEELDTRSLSRMRFAVRCPDETGWKRDVVVRAEVSAQVLVMAEDVPSGRAIKDEDLTLARREVTLIPDALSDAQAAVGMTGSRTLRSGQVLAKRALLLPLLVQRGHSVAIVARNGGIAVSVQGEALDAGREGDVIRVRNTASGKVIRARVIDVGQVEPESIPVSAPSQSRE